MINKLFVQDEKFPNIHRMVVTIEDINFELELELRQPTMYGTNMGTEYDLRLLPDIQGDALEIEPGHSDHLLSHKGARKRAIDPQKKQKAAQILKDLQSKLPSDFKLIIPDDKADALRFKNGQYHDGANINLFGLINAPKNDWLGLFPKQVESLVQFFVDQEKRQDSIFWRQKIIDRKQIEELKMNVAATLSNCFPGEEWAQKRKEALGQLLENIKQTMGEESLGEGRG